ncbi:SAM-dependent methyltransferase [Alteromonas sp. ASW11-130]|uniref:SAM-dependent methyltransferase n=1 Tax=Alteromonas sp. ASW11-130 TaxID=3015775 RepID=UPI002242562A|nr:SAM-dependent methyltransferase [Alteromonas sp. ASW11-130]MCW8091464.1 SAM-dependent methyltransferase [Alteromonas sp. ASW11-130]
MTNQSGSIVCVGVGMTLGSHICPLSRSYIEQADVVFCSMSDKYVEEWVMSMNKDVRSLQKYYAEGKDRRQTYREMIEAMMDEVRSGKKVVGAFYGHPGVFAMAPHKVIKQAREEGFNAHMEPGISAEDCLFADMGLDPGTNGCAHYEASQFLMNEKRFDNTALLILWQIGMVGDRQLKKFVSENRYRKVLQDYLLEHYPTEHQIALYEAAVLPIEKVRIEWMRLDQLCEATVYQHSTLVIPPAKKKTPDAKIEAIMNALDSE